MPDHAPSGREAAELALLGRSAPLRLVIFDCDGVLIDSEATANRIVAEALGELGWAMTPRTAREKFLGMTLTDMEPVIAAHTGRPIGAGWRTRLIERILHAMAHEARLVDGAREALDSADRLGLDWRVASNSSHEELAVKFAATGLGARMQGRVHSHRDVARGKPAPDLFLAASEAAGVPPEHCLVIEDSVPGTAAAKAAGMMCLGLAMHDDGAALREQEAIVIRSMHDVPHLLALATRAAA